MTGWGWLKVHWGGLLAITRTESSPHRCRQSERQFTLHCRETCWIPTRRTACKSFFLCTPLRGTKLFSLAGWFIRLSVVVSLLMAGCCYSNIQLRKTVQTLARSSLLQHSKCARCSKNVGININKYNQLDFIGNSNILVPHSTFSASHTGHWTVDNNGIYYNNKPHSCQGHLLTSRQGERLCCEQKSR